MRQKLGMIPLLTLLACGATDPLPSPSPTPQPTAVQVIENGRYHLVQAFGATLLGNTRDVLIYLPPSYSDEVSREFPVLYMHDGQNLYYDDTAAYGFAWEVDDVADRLVSAGEMEEVIIVGVYNTADRINEYTPTLDQNYGGGDGPLYADFLIHDLKPWVDEHYRTRVGPEDTAVMGSSLGGLISFWLGWTYPEVFGMSGAVSPSFWWNNTDSLTMVQGGALPPEARFYLDIGTAEGEDVSGDGLTSSVKDTRDVRNALLTLGAEWPRTLAYLEVLGGAHNESAWEARVEHPLRWMFGSDELSATGLLLEPYGAEVGVTGVTRLPTAARVTFNTGLQLTVPGEHMVWAAEPEDKATIEADGTLVGISPGEVLISCT